MSPENTAPELEGLGEQLPEEVVEETAPRKRGSLLRTLWLYHPFMMLGVALVMAGVAYSMWPKDLRVRPLELKEAYEKGRTALLAGSTPQTTLSDRQAVQEIRRAQVYFEELMQLYQRDLGKHPELINPYMLYAEASRLAAEVSPFDRPQRIKDAIWGYNKALDWETRDWKESEPVYQQQFSRDGESEPGPQELGVRQQRRNDYLRYWLAVMLLRAEEYTLASEHLRELRDAFRDRRLRSASQQGGRLASSLSATTQIDPAEDRYPPKRFELVGEDRINLHYYLGRANEARGDDEQAESEYNTFLLRAPRGRERFDALMRLGIMHASRGRQAMSQAQLLRGPNRDARARMAERHFESAADKYTQIIDASAPDEILREAYFRAGMAHLAIAEGTADTQRTWWDFVGEHGTGLQQALESFVREGRPLPDRTRVLPGALGRLLMDTGGDLPDPLLAPAKSLLGSGLVLAVRPRQTQRARREELLQQARELFDSSRGGQQGRFDAAANVMIARTLLAQGRHEDARHLYREVRNDYSQDDVQIACRLGEAKSYLVAGELDRARHRFLGGLEKDTPSIFQSSDLHWRDFCARLATEGPEDTPSPSRRLWELLAPDVRSTIRHIANMFAYDDSHERRVLTALNRILRRDDFYTAEDFAGINLPAAAIDLLARERSILREHEVEWLNRLLIETAYPHEVLLAPIGTEIEPLPVTDAHEESILIHREEIVNDLLELVRSYAARADAAQQDAEALRRGTLSAARSATQLHDTAVRERRALRHAIDTCEFLFARYDPPAPEVMAEMAQMYTRLSLVVEGAPFFETERAVDLVATAAHTHQRVARQSEPGSNREEEALWLAAWSFYRAGRQGRTIETLNAYLDRHADSDRAGSANNLLGRAYRDVGRLDDAARVFRANSERQTEDGFKALYYLGWVLSEAATTTTEDGEIFDLLGHPDAPLPPVDNDGIMRIETALQAFNRVRSLPGVRWDSRPYRWATFALGPLSVRIADRIRDTNEADTEGDAANAQVEWAEHYRRAEALLLEGLNRYRLKRSPSDTIGIDWRQEPEDYGEVLAARYINEYYLALTRTALAEVEDDPARREEVRDGLGRLIDTTHFPDILFDTSLPRPHYVRWALRTAGETNARPPRALQLVRLGLGEGEGPEYVPERLASLRRNAFFLLGQEYFDEGMRLTSAGRELGREGRPGEREELLDQARAAYRQAFAVYQSAYDRLPPRDAPQIMYLMGECLRELGDEARAAERYRVARNSARNLPDVATTDERILAPAFWESMASQRLAELDLGTQP